jgi:hypothetical protein
MWLFQKTPTGRPGHYKLPLFTKKGARGLLRVFLEGVVVIEDRVVWQSADVIIRKYGVVIGTEVLVPLVCTGSAAASGT